MLSRFDTKACSHVTLNKWRSDHYHQHRLQTLKVEVQQTTYIITSHTKEELDQDQIKLQKSINYLKSERDIGEQSNEVNTRISLTFKTDKQNK
jgi:hypothetical protein